jgi:ectoine hydroxylase-related dioxygenase (phytanoyl-CoA dioxygenase family)
MINLDTEEYVLDLAIRPGDIDDADAVDIELKAGDISIHNPSIVHGSNSNVSDKWRIGLTLRYIPTSTYVNREGWDCILLRGKPTSWIKNNYTKKPVFDPSEHMPFSGQGVYR